MSERHQQRLGARTRGKSLFSVLGRGQIGCRFSGRAIGPLIQIVEAIEESSKHTRQFMS
jgi:hypothetical protein